MVILFAQDPTLKAMSYNRASSVRPRRPPFGGRLEPQPNPQGEGSSLDDSLLKKNVCYV